MTSKRKLPFQLQGQLIGHVDFPDAQPGDILKLEVGDDDLPTSVLLRSRVVPVGELREEGAECGEDAKQLVKDARAQAKQILADAKTEAAAITDKANADAAELMAAAAGDKK